MDCFFWLNAILLFIIYSFPGEMINQINVRFCISPYSFKRKKISIDSQSIFEHLLFNFVIGTAINTFFILTIYYTLSIVVNLFLLVIFDILTLLITIFIINRRRINDLLFLRIMKSVKSLYNYVKNKIQINHLRRVNLKKHGTNENNSYKSSNFLSKRTLHIGVSILVFSFVCKILFDLYIIWTQIPKNIFIDNYQYLTVVRDLIKYGKTYYDPFQLNHIFNSSIYNTFFLQFILIDPANWVYINTFMIPSIHIFFVIGYIYVILSKISKKLFFIPLLLIYGLTFLPTWLLFGLPSTWIFTLFSILFLHLFNKKNSSLLISVIALIALIFYMPSGFVISFVPLILGYGITLILPLEEEKTKKWLIFVILTVILLALSLFLFFFDDFIKVYAQKFEFYITPDRPWEVIRWDKFSLEKNFRVACYYVVPLLCYIYILDKFGLNGKNFKKYKKSTGFLVFSWIFFIFLIQIMENYVIWANFTKISYNYPRYFIFLDWLYLILIPFSIVLIIDSIFLTSKYLHYKFNFRHQHSQKFLNKINKNRKRLAILIIFIFIPLSYLNFNYQNLLPERWRENSIELKFKTEYYLGKVPWEIPEIMPQIIDKIQFGGTILMDFNLMETRVLRCWLKDIYIESATYGDIHFHNNVVLNYSEQEYWFNELITHIKSNETKSLYKGSIFNSISTNSTFKIKNRTTNYLLFDFDRIPWLTQKISKDTENFEVIEIWDVWNNNIDYMMKFGLVRVLNN